MSDDEDDTPFFAKRAAHFPTVSAEEFQSVSKRICEKDKREIKSSDKEESPSKKAKIGSGLIKLLPESEKKVFQGPRRYNPTDPEPALPAAAKRRLKKFREQQHHELELIKTLNRQVLKETEYIPEQDKEEYVYDIGPVKVHALLNVLYKTKSSYLRCYDHEKFSELLPRIADMFQLKASEILLCLPDRNISMDDTPKSLNITLKDIIVIVPYKEPENTKKDPDKMKLIFQSNDSKNKINILVHKLEKMQDIMEKYSGIKGVPLSQLTFEFDGEKIEGTETPLDLDMESGNCIDVTVIAASPVKVIQVE